MDVLREKVAEWQAGGYVEQLAEPAWCCNPMSVAAKYDPVKDETKLRPVIDLSAREQMHTCEPRQDGRFVSSRRAHSEGRLHGVV